jgi:hypothetical protein
MAEEYKNKELEGIMNEVSRNFSENHLNDKLADIFRRGGGNLRSVGEITEIATINETDKIVEFYGDYKYKARSMKELKPLIDYLDKEAYRWM